MGIDIYARWKNQTEQEREAQITGFSLVSGHVGYLREAYHGEPYATQILVPEAFATNLAGDDRKYGPKIPAALMRARLPRAIAAAIERAKSVDGEKLTEDDETVQSFVEFVRLCEAKERQSGEPCRICASW